MYGVKKNFLPKICLSALVLFAIACDKEETRDYIPGTDASLTISLKGEAVRSKAVAPSGSTGTEALKEAENKLKNVTVFIFNDNGTLDKKHVFTTSGLTETVTGLIAGPKKVVVLANIPSGTVFPDGIDYEWFSDPAHVVDLDTQNPDTEGLFMSGEGTVTLSANTTVSSTVSISRLVSKVKLGTLTLSPEAGHDPGKFLLNKVMIMKARGSATMGVPSVSYTPDLFYGGMAGDKSTVKSYLSETVSAEDHSNRYFYVLPSDDNDGNTTLITLAGTYDGSPVYFPFRINDKAGSDGATSDGSFIRRNHVYVINITLKKLGGGSKDPEVPADPASFAVTVEPQEWETDLIQNVTW